MSYFRDLIYGEVSVPEAEFIIITIMTDRLLIRMISYVHFVLLLREDRVQHLGVLFKRTA